MPPWLAIDRLAIAGRLARNEEHQLVCVHGHGRGGRPTVQSSCAGAAVGECAGCFQRR